MRISIVPVWLRNEDVVRAWRSPHIRRQPASFHAARTFASVGWIGTSRGRPVFTAFSSPVRVLKDAATRSLPSGSSTHIDGDEIDPHTTQHHLGCIDDLAHVGGTRYRRALPIHRCPPRPQR